jgi:putative transposase
MAITDPAGLIAELECLRLRYNNVRLYAGTGYVTPNDEHEGRVKSDKPQSQAAIISRSKPVRDPEL